MAKRKSYVDIGHGGGESLTWVIDDDWEVLTVLARAGTHENLWGAAVINRWRGRFDPESRECSVCVPESLMKMFQYRDVPDRIDSELRKKFGNDIIIYKFNPLTPKKKPKRDGDLDVRKIKFH